MARATSNPLKVSHGSGHHSGSPWNPTLVGRSTKISCWSLDDGVQEEVGNRRHGDTDDGSHEEQDDVAPGPDDRRRVAGAAGAAGAGSAEAAGSVTVPSYDVSFDLRLAPSPRTDGRTMAQRLLSRSCALGGCRGGVGASRTGPPQGPWVTCGARTWTCREKNREWCMPEGLSSSDVAGEISRHRTHAAEHGRDGEGSESDGGDTEPRPDPVRH